MVVCLTSPHEVPGKEVHDTPHMQLRFLWSLCGQADTLSSYHIGKTHREPPTPGE